MINPTCTIDNDGANNTPGNLVPSCRACNSGRASHRRHQALVDSGWWQHNDTVEATSPRKVRGEWVASLAPTSLTPERKTASLSGWSRSA